MPVEKLLGINGGIVFHDGSGYAYRRNKVVKGIAYLKCCANNCPSTGMFDRTGEHIVRTKYHNHSRDLDLPEALALRNRILLRCRLEKGSCNGIYTDELASVPHHIANHPAVSGMRASMHRARASMRPPVPTTLWDYRKHINNPVFMAYGLTLNGEPWLLDIVEDGDGHPSAIFLSPTTKSLLREATKFHIDDTFQCVPSHPQCQQLMTVMALHLDHVFPVSFVLMSQRTRAACRAVFRRLRDEEPAWMPTKIICDYEIAVQEAIGDVFGIDGNGAPSVHGCWFHYSQAIWRRLQSMGLAQLLQRNPEMMMVARMALGLPLLPPTLIPVGLVEVTRYLMANLRDESLQQMLQFTTYVENCWVARIGPERISVYDCPDLMNNDLESYHNTLWNHMGGVPVGAYPEVWQFTSALQKTERENAILLASVQRGKDGKPHQRQALAQAVIQKSTQKLDMGKLTVAEFLARVSHYVLAMPQWNDRPQEMEREITILPASLQHGQDDRPNQKQVDADTVIQRATQKLDQGKITVAKFLSHVADNAIKMPQWMDASESDDETEDESEDAQEHEAPSQDLGGGLQRMERKNTKFLASVQHGQHKRPRKSQAEVDAVIQKATKMLDQGEITVAEFLSHVADNAIEMPEWMV